MHNFQDNPISVLKLVLSPQLGHGRVKSSQVKAKSGQVPFFYYCSEKI